MSRCKHGHHHHHADRWTNFATFGEGISSFISDAYWLSNLFDVITGFSPEALGLSYYGIAFGTVVGLLSAGGAAYSHRSLNTIHQAEEHEHNFHVEENENNFYVNVEKIDISEETPIHHHSHLNWSQKLALIGDFISHTGDIAGPLIFFVLLGTNNKLPRWGKALLQCGAILFGGLSSIANVRTCKDAMEKTNEESAHDQPLVSTFTF